MLESPDFIALLSDPEVMQLMLFACPDGVVVAGPDDRVILYTGACEALFGFPPPAVVRRPVAALFSDELAYAVFRERLAAQGHVTGWELEADAHGRDPFAVSVSAVLLRDRCGDAVASVLYVRDHTRVRAIEEALRENNRRLGELVHTLNEVAQTDQLTGLLNRGSAIDSAQAVLNASGGEAVLGVALFDLDHFKRVNDTHGHLVGDMVLANLAGVLQSVARQGDIVGRFGGEEFIAFLPGADLQAIAAFAERVRLAIMRAPVPLDGGAGLSVTVSAGVAAIPGCTPSLRTAIQLADDRLLEAKRQGRNRVVSSEASSRWSAA